MSTSDDQRADPFWTGGATPTEDPVTLPAIVIEPIVIEPDIVIEPVSAPTRARLGIDGLVDQAKDGD